MASKREDEDSCFSDGGDLGLGKGYKPGGIPISDGDREVDKQFTSVVMSRLSNSGSGELQPDTEHVGVSRSDSHTITDKFSFLLRRSNSESKVDDKLWKIAKYTEIPIGTSIRQQKILFQQDVDELYLMSEEPSGSIKGSEVQVKEKVIDLNTVIEKKLKLANQEIDLLKQDLELCQRQLDAKYKAIRILQKQSFAINNTQAENSKKSQELNKQLQDEINRLQFELEYRQSTLMDSQQTWASRFDVVCLENSHLSSALEGKCDELRRIKCEKIALARERDELLALLDIQEQQRYQSTRSQSSEEEYLNFTSTELAILGACHCQADNPAPCGCAHAAAHMKRQVLSLRAKVAAANQGREEALVTTDAYRIAFEEQLSRNRALMKQMADLSAFTSHSTKVQVKAAIKWFIMQLNEETVTPRKHANTMSENNDAENCSNGDRNQNSRLESSLASKSEEELIHMFVEMISDKTEALAHQRLAARMLAKKTAELEEKLTAVTEADQVFQ